MRYIIRTKSEEKERMIELAKTLYSLMLSDEVIREVDKLAHRSNMSRSALVNQILAEYVDVVTPESRINSVLSLVEELMTPLSDIVPFFAPNSQVLSLKSSLSYKYRPTIKYEVQLNQGNEDTIGNINVLFRTQSSELIDAIEDFFRGWTKIENAHLVPFTGKQIDSRFYSNRYTRSIQRPDISCSAETIANAISEYVKLLDRQLKDYLCDKKDMRDIELEYFTYLNSTPVHI